MGLFCFLSSFQLKAAVGECLHLKSGDYIDFGTSLGNFGIGNFTIETWFRTSATTQTIISKRGVCSQANFWSIRMSSTGNIRFEMCENSGGTNLYTLETPNAYNDNVWHHLAVIRNGTTVKIQMDGYLVVSTVTAGITNLSNSISLKIGQSPCSNFVGKLDETRIWSIDRTQCSVYENRLVEFSGTPNTLELNCHYNQGTANGNNGGNNTLMDASDNGYIGTMINFTLSAAGTGATSNWTNNGCPAQDIFSNPPQGTTTVSACNSYTWNGVVYTTSGSYISTFNSANGCDSLSTLVLSIATPPTSGGNDTTCFGTTLYPKAFTNYNPILDQSNTASNILINGNTHWQSFTPSVNGSLNAMEIEMTSPLSGTSSTVSIQIYEGEGITGTLLGTSALVITPTSPSYAFVNFNLSGLNIYLKSGSQYTVQLTTASFNQFWIKLSNANPYSGGRHNVNASYDMKFKTYMSEIKWYTAASGGAVVANPSKSSAGSITYYAEAYDGVSCYTNRTPVTLVVYKPTVTISGTGSICVGSSTTLTATGASTYLWMPGSLSGSSKSFSPNTSTTYTITGTDSYGCTDVATKVVNVNAIPVVTASATVSLLCSGEGTVLNGGGASTYSWTGGISNGVSFAPKVSTTYTVTGTSTAGCTSTATQSITVNPSYGGARAYVANSYSNSISVIDLNGSNPPTTISPLNLPNEVAICETLQRVYCTNNGTNTVSVINALTNTIVGNINVGVSPYGIAVSPDETKIYVANYGNNTVSVINTITNTVTNTIVTGFQPLFLTISPDGSRLYVSNYLSNSITVINTTTNSVITNIVVGSYPRGMDINSNGSILAVANSGSNSVSFINTLSNSVIANVTVGYAPYSVAFNPSENKLYVTNYFSNNVSVISFPTYVVSVVIPVGIHPRGISITSDGAKAIVINEGGNSLSIINTTTNTVIDTMGNLYFPVNDGNFIMNQPVPQSVTSCGNYTFGGITYTSSGTYTHTFSTINGCDSVVAIKLTIHPKPVVTANASVNPVCQGSAITLSGGGASNYSWTGGVTNGIAFIPSAATYTVTGTDGNGCSNTTALAIAVNPLPTVTANTSANPVCMGSSTTFSGGGASAYSWTGGITNGVAFTPSTSSTYTVTGTDVNGCSNTATIVITINPLPVVTANASVNPVCSGSSTTLIGSGAANYIWSGGVTNGIAFVPSATTYTVTGIDGNGCSNTVSQSLVLLPLPLAPTVSANNNNFCSGGSTTLTAYSMVSYCTPTTTSGIGSLNDYISNFNFNSSAINNTSTHAANNYGDYSATSVNVTAGSSYSFTIQIGGVFGQGKAMWIDYNQDGDFDDAGEYVWSIATAYAPATGTITIPVTAYNGLTRLRIAVRRAGTPGAATSCGFNTFGEFEDYQLNISGATPNPRYSWLPSTFLSSTSGSSVNVNNINASTIYTVSISDANGCSNSSSISITPLPLPIITATASITSICLGAPVSLNATGASSYSWNNMVSNNQSFTPSSSSSYTVTGIDANGCSNTSSITIVVDTCNATMQVKFFIQGFYAGASTMNPVLLNQGVGFSTTNVDTVMVELHSSLPPYNIAYSTSAILQTDGTAMVNFNAIQFDYYYITIKHRNAMETWSTNPVLIQTNSTYDFSTAASQAAGNNQIEMETGIWAIFSGDINQDGAIDAFDYLELDPDIILGNSGYLDTDLTGDGIVDAFDYLVFDPNLTNGIGVILPTTP